jgi:glycosyltransferase involved in cell wall biosynthesis
MRLETSRVSELITYLCIRLNKNIVCVSEAIYRNVGRRFPRYRNKLQIIPNGVDYEFLQISRTARDPSDPFNLLFVGNLIPLKGVHLIIEALAKLGDSNKIQLIIIGDGPEKSSLVSRAERLGLSAQVSFIGAVGPNSMIQWFTKANCLILPSFSEGRPNVILEAMASGLPAVASRIEGISELVSEGVTGQLFKPGDTDGLSRCIEALEKNPKLCARLGEHGRRHIIEHGLIWERVAQGYAYTYRSLAPTEVTRN